MSLNDFEYVPYEPFEDNVTPLELDIAKTILKKKEAYASIDAFVDSVGESWFELGEKLEQKRTLDILDKFESTLVDSEEDAKMVLHVLREMIANADTREEQSEA